MFKMTFDTGNAAFDNGEGEAEVARILAKTAKRIADGYVDGPVSDINGNRIGEWSLSLPIPAED